MKLQVDNLGKVAITIEKDLWSDEREYSRLTIVQAPDEYRTYISRKTVPIGIQLSDRNFWIPFSSLQEQVIIGYNEISALAIELRDLLDNVDGSLFEYKHNKTDIILDAEHASGEKYPNELAVRTALDSLENRLNANIRTVVQSLISRIETLESYHVVTRYTIQFDVDGGNEQVNSITQEQNTDIILPTYQGTKPTYVADGWFINNVLYAFGASYKLTKNVTAVVNWVNAVYGISVIVTNGTTEQSNYLVGYKQSVTINITPNQGYRLPDVINGAVRVSDTSIRVDNVTSAKVINIVCEAIPEPVPNEVTMYSFDTAQIDNYTNSELTTVLNKGEYSLIINRKKYHYIPSDVEITVYIPQLSGSGVVDTPIGNYDNVNKVYKIEGENLIDEQIKYN